MLKICLRNMPRLGTNWGIFYQLRHPKHSFTAIEAVNRGLSTFNFFLTFSEFQIFNENVVYYCDFVHCLNFSDFWKGGVFENPWKSRNWPKSKRKCWFIAFKGASRDPSAREALIFAYKKIHAYWISALEPSHIRLKKNTCLLAPRPAAMSDSLNKKYLLIRVSESEVVIFA